MADDERQHPSNLDGNSSWNSVGERSRIEHILFTFVPAVGSISYGCFSANITNPKQFIKIFSPFELVVANGLWFNSHLGVGLFIYSRHHLTQAPVPYRVLFSTAGSLLFNFGSVLLWATGKAILPQKAAPRVAFGVLSGFGLLLLGYKYLTYVDSLCFRRMPVNGAVPVDIYNQLD